MDDFQWPTAEELVPWLTGVDAVKDEIRAKDEQARYRAKREHYERIQRAREEMGL